MHRKVRPTLKQACNKDHRGLHGPLFFSTRLKAIARDAGRIPQPNVVRTTFLLFSLAVSALCLPLKLAVRRRICPFLLAFRSSPFAAQSR